jgi:hypothetical protein
MSAIRFPLTLDNPGAANPVSPQEGAKVSAGGPSSVLQPDVVTLSAVFPPPPPTEANQAQFQNLAQPALEAFPPPVQPSSSKANATAAAAPPTLTQEEQLAQLNRALELLGISPQSISLDNRLALIRSANDPPALLNLVRALGVLTGSAAGTSAPVSGASANNLPDPVQLAAPTQTPAPLEVSVQVPVQLPPLSATSFQNSSSPAGSGFGATLQANQGQPTSTAQGAPNVQGLVPNSAAVQFQELQVVFQSAESQQNAGGNTDSGTQQPSTISILA